MFPCCITREDLSNDVSITNEGLISTKLGRFHFSGYGQIQFRQFRTFWEKNQLFGFQCCSTREDLPIDVSITNVRLILTKLRWFQLFVKIKIRISTFFEKKRILGFPWCSTREDLSIDVPITNVGLILTRLRWFQLFSASQNSNFELFVKKNSNFWVSML